MNRQVSVKTHMAKIAFTAVRLRGYWSLKKKNSRWEISHTQGMRLLSLAMLSNYSSSSQKHSSINFFFATFWETLPKQGGSTKFHTISPLRVYFEIISNLNISCMIYKSRPSRSIFLGNGRFSRNCEKPPIFRVFLKTNISPPKVGPKETHGNTHQTVDLRQDDILEFEWFN